MTRVGFTVRFHTAFRVGAAHGRDGLHAAVDYHDPLPADHLKGLMRSAAQEVLHLSPDVIGAVFGDTARPCPWSWSSAIPYDGQESADGPPDGPDPRWRFAARHRVRIDSDTHTATKDQFVVAEQAWTRQARFTVRLRGALTAEQAAGQALLLRAAGAAVHGVGAWRRRGLGWVGVRPDEPLTEADLATLVALRAGAEPAGALR